MAQVTEEINHEIEKVNEMHAQKVNEEGIGNGVNTCAICGKKLPNSFIEISTFNRNVKYNYNIQLSVMRICPVCYYRPPFEIKKKDITGVNPQ